MIGESSMECSPTHNIDEGHNDEDDNDDEDKQCDMDTMEQGQEVEMQHPPMPPPFMPPRRHMGHVRFRE